MSKYSNKPIKMILKQIAGSTTFGDLSRYILICAFCIDGIGDSKGIVVRSAAFGLATPDSGDAHPPCAARGGRLENVLFRRCAGLTPGHFHQPTARLRHD